MLFKMHNPGACDEVCSSAVRLRSQANGVWQLENILRLALFPLLSAASGKISRPAGEAAARTAVGRSGDAAARSWRRGCGSMCAPRVYVGVSLRALMQLTAAEMDDAASRRDLWRTDRCAGVAFSRACSLTQRWGGGTLFSLGSRTKTLAVSHVSPTFMERQQPL